jgi:endonuclease III
MSDNGIDRDKVMVAYRGLIDIYGEIPWEWHGDPVDELVLTILSQNTSDHNSAQAFMDLRKALPTWEMVVDAPTEHVSEAIRFGGLAKIKAPRIQEALQHIFEHIGAFSLEFLRDMPIVDARKWLTSLRGVGPKTASCVLLFSMGIPAFPVDTHVHRVSLRLGLMPPKTSAGRMTGLYEETVDSELYYPYHKLLIRHGRTTCKAQRPRCEECGLADLCDHYSAEQQQQEQPTGMASKRP